MYRSPQCLKTDSVPTQWLLDNLKTDYKVIYVGDASMAPGEFFDREAGFDYFRYSTSIYMNDFKRHERSGEEWLKALKQRFPASVWLNPMHWKLWNDGYAAYTVSAIRKIIPMYQLSASGLDRAIQQLKAPAV